MWCASEAAPLRGAPCDAPLPHFSPSHTPNHRRESVKGREFQDRSRLGDLSRLFFPFSLSPHLRDCTMKFDFWTRRSDVVPSAPRFCVPEIDTTPLHAGRPQV